MIDWIAEHCEPDVIHLSNALLLGLAHRLSEKLHVPVICSLQDEDVWVDVMKEGSREMVWNLMASKGDFVSKFVSVSDFYAGEMKQKLKIPEKKLSTVHIGVDTEDYPFIPQGEKNRNIGYISRMCEMNGLDILVDAYIELKQQPGFEDVKLILTGGSTGDDSSYLRRIRKKVHSNGLTGDVIFHEDFEGEGRLSFLRQVSVISVPVRHGEAFGIYLLEAMASGIPVVQPALGAFPEIIGIAGGGLTYEPNSPTVLAKTLEKLLSDPGELEKLSLKGREGVVKHFDVALQVEKTLAAYQDVLK
jgi:glycosyltransferase involved in cell wall biosynthesis